jgi:hypothetical protein
MPPVFWLFLLLAIFYFPGFLYASSVPSVIDYFSLSTKL